MMPVSEFVNQNLEVLAVGLTARRRLSLGGLSRGALPLVRRHYQLEDECRARLIDSNHFDHNGEEMNIGVSPPIQPLQGLSVLIAYGLNKPNHGHCIDTRGVRNEFSKTTPMQTPPIAVARSKRPPRIHQRAASGTADAIQQGPTVAPKGPTVAPIC